MGLLDQYFDPETLAQLKQLNQPSEEQKAAAQSRALGQMGWAMLANKRGASSGQAFSNALGNGGMAFNQSYQNSINDSREQNMQPFQTAMALKKLSKENLPSGMQMGQDGKPMWIPGYIEGQEQLRKTHEQPYFNFLPTANGYAIGDARKGTITMPSSPMMRASDDPTLQGRIAGAKETGKSLAEAQTPAQPQTA